MCNMVVAGEHWYYLATAVKLSKCEVNVTEQNARDLKKYDRYDA